MTSSPVRLEFKYRGGGATHVTVGRLIGFNLYSESPRWREQAFGGRLEYKTLCCGDFLTVLGSSDPSDLKMWCRTCGALIPHSPAPASQAYPWTGFFEGWYADLFNPLELALLEGELLPRLESYADALGAAHPEGKSGQRQKEQPRFVYRSHLAARRHSTYLRLPDSMASVLNRPLSP